MWGRKIVIANLKNRCSPLALMVASLALIPSNVWAQQADTAEASEKAAAQDDVAGANRSVGEIIVTARKRSERLQDTPIAVTAISAAALESRGVDSFKDFANAVPNVDINGGIPNGGGSAVQMFIRGVGQDDYSFPNEPGVGLYIDGVYITRTVGGDFGFMDVEQIEVLRGPQGTLYGKNTIGGAIKVTTKKPNGDNGGRVELTTGSFDRLDMSGVVDFSLTDNLFGKIAVTSRNRDGLGRNFIDQDLGNENKSAARLTLRYMPSSDIDIVFINEYSKQRQNGPAGSMAQFLANGTTEGLINPVLVPPTAQRLGLTPPFDTYNAIYEKTLENDGKDVYNSGGTVETRDWAEIFGSSLSIGFDLGDMSIQSISAYRWADIDIRRDSDHTPFDLVQVNNPETTSQLSQEFQLNGEAFGERLNFVLGVFGIRERGKATLFAPLLSGLFDAIGFDNTANAPQSFKGYSLAAFGEGTFAITDQLNLTAGGRLTHDNKKYTYSFDRPESGVTIFENFTQKFSTTEFLPKVSMDYHFNPDIMTYATFSKGYKAGGFNSRVLSGNPPASYEPEFLTSYELGLKTTLFGGRATANFAGFYSDYKDVQLLSVIDIGGGNVETVISNAGAGRVIGGEAEFNAEPIDDLFLGVGLGVLKTKYTEVGQGAIDSGILESNSFINSPEVTLTTTLDYTLEIANSRRVKFHVDGTYKSSQFRDAPNTPSLKTDAYWIGNARVAFEFNDTFEVAAFVSNFTDEVYLTNGVNVLPLGYVEAYYSRPREWGVSLIANF
jgi:iron complex outermembrane receptor protein